jgi:hypothetical protein
MTTTIAEITLSETYRNAQRVLADWLEREGTSARRRAFLARAALARLDAVERYRLARWLAWLCMAASVRGESLIGRIKRLDTSLGTTTADAFARLPVSLGHGHAQKAEFGRIVSADTALHMTFVRSSR